MEKFTIREGVAAPILRINVDTDAIIPSREMKKVSKLGLGEGLFAVWRYTEPGGREPNPEFVLNKTEYANTTIILSGVNFGCGSSREHAVWALTEYGIRCIIAPSFGAIFYQNCVRNGILPVMLPDDAVKQLAAEVETAPQQNRITINLENKTVVSPNGKSFSFEIEDDNRNMLLNGWDAIGLTLSMNEQISAFEQRDKATRPWAYLE